MDLILDLRFFQPLMIMFVFLEMYVLIMTPRPRIDLLLCGLPRTSEGGSRAGRYHFHAPNGESSSEKLWSVLHWDSGH